MEQLGRDRVDAFWRQMFGADAASSRFVVTRHRSHDLRDYPGIHAIVRQQTVYVSAPEDLAASIGQWQPKPATASDPAWWRRNLPGWLVLGPSVHAFTDQSPPCSAPTRWKLEPIASEQLTDLQAMVEPAEWSESGFAGNDVALAWRATDDTGGTIAAANLTPFDGSPVDVGVLTSPAARGRGAATTIATVATRHAVRKFGIARWRALTTNTASLRIAERLGFEADCLHLALRPPTGA